MMPKTRSRKFAPIFSSRRFIVLGIIFMCAIHLELNFVHRGHLSSLAFGNVWVLWACPWLCTTSPASLLTGCGMCPRRMTSGCLLSAQGQPLIGAAPPRCFPGSRRSPGTKNTASEGTGPKPSSSQKEKRCFWSLRLNFQAPSQVHEGLW